MGGRDQSHSDSIQAHHEGGQVILGDVVFDLPQHSTEHLGVQVLPRRARPCPGRTPRWSLRAPGYLPRAQLGGWLHHDLCCCSCRCGGSSSSAAILLQLTCACLRLPGQLKLQRWRAGLAKDMVKQSANAVTAKFDDGGGTNRSVAAGSKARGPQGRAVAVAESRHCLACSDGVCFAQTQKKRLGQGTFLQPAETGQVHLHPFVGSIILAEATVCPLQQAGIASSDHLGLAAATQATRSQMVLQGSQEAVGLPRPGLGAS